MAGRERQLSRDRLRLSDGLIRERRLIHTDNEETEGREPKARYLMWHCLPPSSATETAVPATES
jgi:hypothetical protein